MKFAENKAFPHPVLSKFSDDYIGRDFQAAFKFDAATGAPTLRVRCTLSDEALEQALKSGQAEFAIETHCPQTFLRRIDKSHENEMEINFEKGCLHGHVELNAFVVCTARISKFRSPNFNSEFGANATFDLEPGDVLAMQPPFSYWWDMEQIRPIGTIFELVESAVPKSGSFIVSWDENKIQIGMRKNDRERFAIARQIREKKPILLMSVYFPALMETLWVMCDEDDDHKDKKWFQAIMYKINEEGLELSPDRILNIAQELLGMPLNGIIGQMEK